MTEADLKKHIMNYLKTVPGLHAFRVEPSPYGGMRGISDILFCYQGRFVAMEVKHGRGKTTALQDRFLKKVAEAGGVAVVVRDMEGVKECIRRLSDTSKN